MRILYVTGMCAPIKDILSGKSENEITGTPAFFHPWHKLVQRGHQVDFVILSNFCSEPDIVVDWFSEDNIVANIYDPYTEVPPYRRIFRRIKRFLKLLYFTNKAINETAYDFIYCKSVYEGLAGNIVANLRGIPCGMRSLGTMLYPPVMKYGAIAAAIMNPLEFLTFRLKKEFFLMTDDGTKGDVVYEKLKSRKKLYDFYFWKTGISFAEPDVEACTDIVPDHDYLFCAARFDPWKRQDRVLGILRRLHSREKYLHLYLAGDITSKVYRQEIQALVHEYGLDDYVHFLGTIRQDELKLLAHHAIANPLMYEYSNLGNVFFESFVIGSVIIGKNDGSLDDYLVDGVSGFLVNDEDEACLVVERLLENREMIDEIRNNTRAVARDKFLSIDERFDMEVALIERTVGSVG